MAHSHEVSHLDPPTPAFVVDVPVLNELVTRFQQALKRHWPNSILSYSFKTNSLPWLVSHLREQNVWAEVVSDTEYELALALGYGRDRIVYNGPIKGRDQLRAALQGGSLINLDAKREVTWAAELAREMPDRKFKVGIRVNWNLEKYCPGESTAGSGVSRFGFNVENGEFDSAHAELTEAGVQVAGLHMHRNSFTQSLDVFRAAATVAANTITSRNLKLDWIDIGGGFFGKLEGSPTFDDYVVAIKEVLEPVIDTESTTLVVEPGGSLIAVPLEFHASVLDVKDVENSRIVVTDVSRVDIDPLFRRRRPFAIKTSTHSSTIHPAQIVGGFTCMEDDRLLTIEDSPELQVGDRIIFYRVGGYTMSYQSLFIEYLPAVYARTEDALILARKRWGVEEYLQKNEWIDGTLSADNSSSPLDLTP